MVKQRYDWFGWLGVISLISYTLAVIVSPSAYPGYQWMRQAVSDLSALNAPSRLLWMQLGSVYGPASVACLMLCCKAVTGHLNRPLRLGIYGFTLMNWISILGYSAFPLSGESTPLLIDRMHLVVTVLVVVFSVVSLVLISWGGFRNAGIRSLSYWAIFALLMMVSGALLSSGAGPDYFGLFERFSVFSASGFTAVLGLYLLTGFKQTERS